MNDPPRNHDAEIAGTAAVRAAGSAATDARTPGQSFTPGMVVAGRYRIDAYLAEGGMGRVYRAHDLVLDVSLALKTIHPDIASNPAALRLLKQEVLLARSVSHPNVCRIFDLWQDEPSGVSGLTMELLPGETLASRIQTRGALPPGESLPLVRQMAEALDAAHRAGIVHRDFKSANVMVVPDGDRGRAVITDFGLAMAVAKKEERDRRSSPEEALTRRPAAPDEATQAMVPLLRTERPDPREPGAGAVMGTPAYMSPEQVSGGAIGPASDLYSLGVVLFEMCTGQLPFRGATPGETARAHLTMDPPSPRTLAGIEETWERAILRLLSKSPAARFATAHDVVLALDGRLDDRQTTRHFLPAEHDAFVGRTSELGDLAAYLEGSHEHGAVRLLTLQGPGGTGKTRLAQRYGRQSLSRWPGGVWFCDLSEARTAEGIAVAVATALNVPLGKEDPIVQLGNAIAGRGKILLILDNFEQVVAHADATIGRWLERAAETTFLVTSQERLHLPPETTLELAPLDPTTQGVELFDARARGHRPGFVVDAANRGTVEEIVQSLDGLPLAIELAAARLRMLSLEQLRGRLRDRFRLLSGGQKGRHATLRTTLDWSWDLLQPWEQSAMAQASVFEGGFTLEAAEAVIDLSAFEEGLFVLDLIQSLVDKSWLRAKVALGAPRFEMYATVQAYASAKLCRHEAEAGQLAGGARSPADSAWRPEAGIRHGAHFAGMGTEESIESLDRHGGVAKRAALWMERDNLVAACRQAIDREDEGTAAGAYLALDPMLALRGPFALSVQLGREVLACTHEPTRRGRVLLVLAEAERLCGQIEAAQEHYAAALAGSRAVGNRRHEGIVLGNLGSFHGEQGRSEEALEHDEASLAIHRETGNRRGEGVVLGHLGILHKVQGRMEEARGYYQAALAIHRQVGNRRFEGGVLGNLGNLHLELGRREEALAYYEASLAIHREMDNRRFEGIVLGNLGVLHREEGRMEEAHAHYEAALAIHREVGDRRFEGSVLGNLGNLHQEQGRMEEALTHYEAALAIHREVGNRSSEGTTLSDLGHLHAQQRRMAEARRCFNAGIAILRELQEDLELGIGLCDLGEFELQLGDVAAARAALAEAEAIDEHLATGPESEIARAIGQLRRSLAGATPGA